TASGASLAALLLPVGLLGAMEYCRRGQVNIPYAIILAAGLFVGAFIGAHLAGGVSDVALKRAFGGLLLLVAGKLLLGLTVAWITFPSNISRNSSWSSCSARSSYVMMYGVCGG